jgi:ArsR family transcriptional regulator
MGRSALWDRFRFWDAGNINSTTLESRTVEERAQVFSALGDPIRLQILDALAVEVRCVCDLQEIVEAAPNLLSYHLKVLREAGFIEGTKRGRWVDYALTPNVAELVATALPVGLRG